jgi:glycosyltransferase involved in cell wall biosynthesis
MLSKASATVNSVTLPLPNGCGAAKEDEAPALKLRVALVSSSSGSRGGGELYLCSLAEGLSRLGHEVQSVLSEHPRMNELAERLERFGPVHRIPYRNTYDRPLRSLGAVCAWRDIRDLTHVLERLSADVIHLNKQNLEDGLDLLLAAERTAIPTVATIHVTRTMYGLRSVGGFLRDGIARCTLRAASFPFIAIARSGLADLTSIGIDPRRLHLVWNGVPPAPQADREAIRKAWGCRPDDFVLGCIARIEPQKNPLFLPKLLAQLPGHVRLVWIGDGSLRQDLEQCLQAAGVADRVILPGWQHQARGLLAGFDLFVLPSLYEGFPLAILEAMAAGLPCVASDVDGVAEAVIDGETGFVCPVNDIESWRKRMLHCLTHPGELLQMGRRGLHLYHERFSVEAMARGTTSVYGAAIGSASVRRTLP